MKLLFIAAFAVWTIIGGINDYRSIEQIRCGFDSVNFGNHSLCDWSYSS